MKKFLSIILSITMLFGILTVGATASAKTLSELPKYTLNKGVYKQNLNLTSDSVVTVYTSAAYDDEGDAWGAYLRIYDSNNVQIHEEYASSSAPGTVYEYKFFLSKGNYKIGVEASYGKYAYLKVETAPTNLYGSANKVQNGKLINYTYLLKDNISYLTLNENAAVNVYFTLPKQPDGTLCSLDLVIKNSSGVNVVDEFYYRDSQTGNYTFNENFLLAKGSYTINLQLSSGAYDLNSELKTNQYKITYSSASKYTIKTPVLTQKTSKSGSSYQLSFTWPDNENYDGIELWTKTNNGKWVLDETLENGNFFRYKGVNVYYYAGNVAYYKVRAYKSGYGFKKYSAYSNVISMKKLDKPTGTISAGKRKISIRYNAVTGASGYQIRYKLSNKKQWTTKTYSSARSATRTIKNLKKGKKYNVQVRAYKKIGKDKLYSSWSAKKRVKVK